MSVKYSIYYLDDEKANTYFFLKRFQSQYSVSVFQKTEEFFYSLRDFTPDLIVLDLMMPQMTGFDVLNILRATERFRFIPVMVLTAMDKSQSLTNCFELGVDDFMLKPADYMELSVRMQSLIHRFYKGRDHIQKRRIDSMKRMISGFNHEFNNHLTILQSGIEMLGMSLSDDKSKNRVQMLKGTIQRSADLLRVLTNLYVPKNDDDRFPELKELCETIKTILSTDYLDRGFALKMSFCEIPDGLYASLGETGVMQVFHVLLQNCHESFSGVNDRSQEVCIVSEYLEDTIKFSISDNGSGIPQSHLPKIFDLFFTTKGSLGGQIVGNKRTERGLGLSLLEGLLRDCGGSIKVESLEGQGTSVTLYIPVGTSSALLGEGELSITEEGRSLNEPLNIVLFHDQPMDSQILLRFLELQGQSVEVVCSLEDLKQHNFCDVLFLNHSCLNECQMAAAQMTTQVPDAFEVVYFVNGTEDSLLPSKEGKTWKVMKKPLNFAYLTRLLNRIRYSPVFSRY